MPYSATGKNADPEYTRARAVAAGKARAAQRDGVTGALKRIALAHERGELTVEHRETLREIAGSK